jgi:phosphoribosylamine---glycine ligase
MPPARDYKRLLDGDRGPNTGGMGGYTRPPEVSQALVDQVRRDILEPTVAALASEGVPYRGVLYAGLMLTADGPTVLEFNCRFGDPEAELLLPLLASPLSEVCEAVAAGRLEPDAVRWRPGSTCGVVLAAPGYPACPRLGTPLSALDIQADGAHVFHAGTRCVDGQLVTAGGRVLVLVAEGDRLPAARARVYAQVPRVHFEGAHYRRDIGLP